MSNLLQNPNMGNWKHVSYFTEQSGNTGTIEAPANWEYVYVPKESDPNKIPQSLHRDNGFVMSAGYRSWEAGYKQSGVQLAPGRYRLKANFKADVNFPGGQAPDLTAITWRFTVETPAGNVEQDWAMTSKGQTKQTEDFYLIFDVAEATTGAVTFWGRSFYAGNDCDFWVYEITLETIEKSSAIVPVIGTAGSQAQVEVTEQMQVSDVESALEAVGEGDRSLGSASLTVNEIDQIAGALRSLGVSTNDVNISNGLNKLAEVLERLK